MTRVARADAGLWLEILRLNRDEVLHALDELTERLDGLRGALAAADDEGLRGAWAHAAGTLAAVDAARWEEPAWSPEPVEGWPGLLALGREGRAVRRLALREGALHAEVAR
jgi:hypothetical protein